MPKRLRVVDLSHVGVGFAAIALAAVLWAIAAVVASSLFQTGVSPLELAMARAVIAAIGLGIVHQWQPRSKVGNWQILALGISLALVTRLPTTLRLSVWQWRSPLSFNTRLQR